MRARARVRVNATPRIVEATRKDICSITVKGIAVTKTIEGISVRTTSRTVSYTHLTLPTTPYV